MIQNIRTHEYFVVYSSSGGASLLVEKGCFLVEMFLYQIHSGYIDRKTLRVGQAEVRAILMAAQQYGYDACAVGKLIEDVPGIIMNLKRAHKD